MHEQTGPRRCRIVVRGRVGEHVAAGFGGFEFERDARAVGELGIQLVSINEEEPRR